MPDLTMTQLAEKAIDLVIDGDPTRSLTARARTVAALLPILNDARDLGTLAVEAPEPRTAFGQPADPEKREGIIVRVIHTIEPEKIAEHGETVLIAWIQQTVRELASNGANPFRDATIQLVGMPDGSTLVTAEAGLS